MTQDKDLEQTFQKDIAEHEIQVLHDNGVYRHLRFRRPHSMSLYFDLVTWPGHLCYCGDMGDYVFARVYDMFEFFRGDGINPYYWSEKLLAVDRNSPAKKFNYDHGIEQVKEYFAFEELEPEEQDELLEELGYIEEDDERAFYQTVMGFRSGVSHPFQDFFEIDCSEYTFRYLWACQAIVWGIKQYDLHLSATHQGGSGELPAQAAV